MGEAFEPISLEIEHQGRVLHVLDWTGPSASLPILCIHGGCANAHWWDYSANALRNHHRVLALDLAGHGDSAAIDDGSYSLDSHASDVAHVVRSLNLGGFALMGHSFGGFVSLAALPKLEELRALILVDSRGHIRQRSARYLRALGKFSNPRYTTQAEAMRHFQLLPRKTFASEEVLAHVARHSFRRDDSGQWSLAFDRRALRAAQERHFDTEIAALQSPALLIRGSESTALSESALAELGREIPSASLRVIADAHHHVMLDQPTRLARTVAEFLSGLPR